VEISWGETAVSTLVTFFSIEETSCTYLNYQVHPGIKGVLELQQIGLLQTGLQRISIVY